MDLLLFTTASQPTAEVLPALGLLAHRVRVLAPDVAALLDPLSEEVILLDARHDLAGARTFLATLVATGSDIPVFAVLTEGGLVALSAQWPLTDFVLDTVGPAELDVRLRLAGERRRGPQMPGRLLAGELCIEEATYTARLTGAALDLTYKEFELLKFLTAHPGRVFSRAQLVQEVWGYDYFGGTRTVDVHVRRLRAKLGPEHEAMIGTVRNVGYKFVRPPEPATRAAAPEPLEASDDRQRSGVEF